MRSTRSPCIPCIREQLQQHAIMGMVYGVCLANLYPHAALWAKLHSAFGAADYGAIASILTLHVVGVFTSGLRDLAAGRKLARTGERLPA